MTNQTIEEAVLKRVIGLYGTPNCDNLHHNIKQQHTGSEICPVVREIKDSLSSLEITNTNPTH